MSESFYESKVLTFKLGESEYAVDIETVDVILGKYEIFKVPNSQNSLAGVINVKGEIIPVVDVDRAINRDVQKSLPSSIIIAKIGENKIGFLTGEVAEIMEVHPFEFASMKTDGANYIKSVIIKGKRLISLLDLQHFTL
ncbi:chemotaxis protein CheW [Athalassotoga sp.]|uniref:chemotaxis protein CheW n=1 Tax=Athalassotoga sp. TaxID=2022597 RepID=UPI003D08B956